MKLSLDRLRVCIVMIAVSALTSGASVARAISPEPPSVVYGPDARINHIDLGNYPTSPAALFEPLWPPYSDYYLSTPDTFVEPQVYWNPDGAIGDESIPAGYINFQVSMPPMPIAPSLYSGYINRLGSALDMDPLFWKGVHSTLGGGSWNFYTVEMSHLPGRSNYHNRFQAMVDFDSAVVNGVGVAGWEWPPYWQPGGHGGNFTDWVDLYAPYLSRAFFEDILDSAESYNSDTGSPGFGRYGFPRVGSPQHVELPPNYPPRTTSVARSTSPLIPASGGDSHGSYVTRETVADLSTRSRVSRCSQRLTSSCPSGVRCIGAFGHTRRARLTGSRIIVTTTQSMISSPRSEVGMGLDGCRAMRRFSCSMRRIRART